MADVITRFKLETTQYDSKLRDASKSLAEYTRKATLAGNEFGKFTQKNIEAAHALGTITPSATNAKDKVKELVGAFNDAARAYNALTKEQQQSDFGKAMAESLGQLSDKVKEAKQELYGMGDALNKTGGGGLFGGGKLDGMLQVFGGNLMTKGFDLATSAALNFVNTVKDAAAQGIEMAKSGEGIRNAFERLNDPGLLDNLRQATHGTVTNLELMKAAVKFNDFKLPLDQLGTMLAFAQQKAKDTGQSVDYMVDSIVTGLGRKSLMILDNLGLSATEIREKMKETGDMTTAVGEIIREQMASAGDYVETAAERATAADVDLKNAMEDLGRTLLPLQEQGESMWNALEIGALKLLNDGVKPLVPVLINLKETIGNIAETVSNSSVWDGYITALGAVADKAAEVIPGLGKVYMLMKFIRGNGSDDMGAGIGAAISGAMSADAGMLPEIVVTPTKKTPKGSISNKKSTAPTYAEDSIAAQSALVSDLKKKWSEAGEAVRNDLLVQLIAAEDKLKAMNNQAALFRENQQGKLLGGDIQTSDLGSITSATTISEKSIQDLANKIKDAMKDSDKSQSKGDKYAIDGISQMNSGISSIVSGIESLGIEIPEGLKQGLSAVQGITNILLGISATVLAIKAITGADAFLPLARGGVVHAAGGVVAGNTYSNDQIPALLNAGEVVLNRAQVGNLASQLQDGGRGNGRTVGVIRGEDIVLVADCWGRRTGKGELVFFK